MIREKRRGGGRYAFKKAWRWPDQIEDFIKKHIRGYSLHVCCGSSDVGDIKIDKYVQGSNIINADMLELPFKRETFDTVICDPPWELDYIKRNKLLYSLRDILKPGGKLLFICLWWPKCRGLEIHSKTINKNFSVLFVAQKVNGSLKNYDKNQM